MCGNTPSEAGLDKNLRGSMSKQTERSPASGRAQFESPLRLWIAIWQRQLVYGTA